MWNNWGFRILVIVILSFIFFYTFNSKNTAEKPPSLEYASRLKIEREGKDKYLKENENSPIENKATFNGLKYFDIDERFKVQAELVRDQSGDKKIISTTDNKADTMLNFGIAKFKIDGKNYQLSIFQSPNARLLFLPFRDKTCGSETYGGGRFLDIPATDIIGDKIIIDFNLAYHPYCAYNHTYICPIPPKENTLDIPIKVGEKL